MSCYMSGQTLKNSLVVSGSFPGVFAFGSRDLDLRAIFDSNRTHQRLVQVHSDDETSLRVAVSLYGGGIVVYDLSSLAEPVLEIAPVPSSPGLACFPGGTLHAHHPRLVTGNAYLGEGSIWVVDATTGGKIGDFKEAPKHSFRFLRVPQWSESEFYCGGANSSSRRVLDCFDVENGSRTVCFGGGSGKRVSGLAADSERGILMATIWEKSLRLFSKDSPHRCIEDLTLTKRPSSVYCAEDRCLLLVGTTGEVEVWDYRNTTTCIRVFEGQTIRSVAEVGERLSRGVFVIGDGQGHLTSLNVDSGKVEARYKGIMASISSIVQMKDGMGPLESCFASHQIEERIRFVVRVLTRSSSVEDEGMGFIRLAIVGRQGALFLPSCLSILV